MNRSITFCKLILATVTVLVVATPAGVMAQATDPESLINTCQDALRAGDVGAALAVFADDAVGNLVPPPPNMDGVLAGKGALRGQFEAQLALNRVVEIMNLQVDGNRVTWQETYGDDSLPPTIEELELDMEAVVQDGLMQCYTAALTGDSLAKLQAAGPPPNLPESGGTVLPGYVGWLMLAGLGMVTLGWTLSRNAHNRDG